MKAILIQIAQELEFRLDASKGGNMPDVTEDHRYAMLRSLQTIYSVIARKAADAPVQP